MSPPTLKEVKDGIKELVAFVLGVLMILIVLLIPLADNLGFKPIEIDVRLLVLIFVFGIVLAFWFRLVALLNMLKSANIKGPGGIEVDLDGSDRRVTTRREEDQPDGEQ